MYEPFYLTPKNVTSRNLKYSKKDLIDLAMLMNKHLFHSKSYHIFLKNITGYKDTGEVEYGIVPTLDIAKCKAMIDAPLCDTFTDETYYTEETKDHKVFYGMVRAYYKLKMVYSFDLPEISMEELHGSTIEILEEYNHQYYYISGDPFQ